MLNKFVMDEEERCPDLPCASGAALPDSSFRAEELECLAICAAIFLVGPTALLPACCRPVSTQSSSTRDAELNVVDDGYSKGS